MNVPLFRPALVATASLIAGISEAISVPVVTQDQNRLVTVTYSLDADAIVTMEVLTNSAVQVDAANYWNVEGDVNKLVKAGGTKTITWQPDVAWPVDNLATGLKVKLTAWPSNKPPLYMVVNLDSTTGKDIRYYASSNAIPGGIFGSPCYRDMKMVFRRIDAKGVAWTMGYGADDRGRQVPVTLDNDYWLGIFEVSRGQWYAVRGEVTVDANLGTFWAMRPYAGVPFTTIREGATNVQNDDYDYPNPPHSSSFLGILRTRTGVAFDLPSEAQWEFGARSGLAINVNNTGVGNWNDIDVFPGRIRENGGKVPDGSGGYRDPTPDEAKMPEWGVAPIGSYEPNLWGIYDAQGNVRELCLDHYAALHTDKPSDLTASGGVYKVSSGSHTRVARGNNWDAVAFNNMLWSRGSYDDTSTAYQVGFRVACTIPAGDAEPISAESVIEPIETRGVWQTLSAAGKLLWSKLGFMLIFR